MIVVMGWSSASSRSRWCRRCTASTTRADPARDPLGTAPRPASSIRAGRGDAGETLLETLVTVTILGIAVVALLAGIGATLRLSSTHRDLANADVVLDIGAEAVRGATPPTCSALTVASYQPAITAITTTLPSGWTTSRLTITGATCDNASTLKLQTITVKATAPGSTANEFVSVVRRSTP